MKGENSVFVLDFGRIVAVEFNRAGACRLYSKDKWMEMVPDLWSTEPFIEKRFRDDARTLARFTHWPLGEWEDKLHNKLAHHGIRP